ncbi:MAG: hypothetical protein HZB53_11305 [Chloroflexi bacterium]|nr:hypothetical protein [Chloroflexota bacterium]
MSRQAAITRFRVRNGQGSAGAPNILSVADVPQRPPLYVLVETGADDALAARIIFAIDETYRRARGSLTGALQQVVRAAGQVLRQSPGAQCGLTALIIQKDEALLAQVEPAACWILRDGHLMRWPLESVWLDGDTGGEVLRHMRGGLGESDPDLLRIGLYADDKLMLATATVARDVGELLIAEALSEADPGAALHRLAPDVDFTVLAIEPSGQPASRSAIPAANMQRARAVEPAPSDARTAAVPTPNRRTAREAVPAVEKSSAPREPRVPDPEPQARPSRVGLTLAVPHPPAEAKPPREFHLPDLRPYLEVVAISVLYLAKALAAFLRIGGAIAVRALPEHESTTPRVTPSVRRVEYNNNPLDSSFARLMAFGLPAVVIALGAVMWFRSNADNTRRYSDLVAQATSAYQTAMASEGNARRTGLEKAAALLNDAIKIQPSDSAVRDSRARDLQGQVGKELDVLNKATTFYLHPQLYTFDEPGSKPGAVVARGNELYVLDSGTHRLYKFLLNDARDQLQPTPTRSPSPVPSPNPVVMRQGDERGSIVVGALSDIFWGTAGGGRISTGLLTLTAQKQVIEYAPARGITVLSVAVAPGWQEATFGESFNGSLYVLDAKANRILKFAPTGEEYKTPPVDYLSPLQHVDFAGATGMAVDGFVWVALADGTIMKFDAGNLVAFDKRGLDTPLRKPVAIVAQANSPSLWVADAGNRRIVQFNKTGEYVRQYKPDDAQSMSDLRGLAIDEATRRLYWVSGTTLYLTPLQN